MIGKVSGRLDYRGTDHVLIETGGVGYVIHCSERTLALMPAPGGAVALYTEMVVREDLMQLFGFSTRVEKEWHRLLTTVQGVGAKAALAILGTLGPDGVSRAIALGDMSAIKSAPGIGPKIAQRVVLELKQKAPQIMAMGAGGAQEATVSGAPETPVATPPAQPAAAVAGGNSGAVADALSALINLGYSPGDAAGAVAEINANDPEAETPALIRAALKLLAPKG